MPHTIDKSWNLFPVVQKEGFWEDFLKTRIRQPIIMVNLNWWTIAHSPQHAFLDNLSALKDAFPGKRPCPFFCLKYAAHREKFGFEKSVEQGVLIC